MSTCERQVWILFTVCLYIYTLLYPVDLPYTHVLHLTRLLGHNWNHVNGCLKWQNIYISWVFCGERLVKSHFCDCNVGVKLLFRQSLGWTILI